MSDYRFRLQPYKGISTRHTCPECKQRRCFSRYIDTEGKISFLPMSDDATMSSVAGITMPQANISRTILMSRSDYLRNGMRHTLPRQSYSPSQHLSSLMR